MVGGPPGKVHCLYNTSRYIIDLEGAQWLSGRVLDSRPKVRASPASLLCGP